jgi:para-nitrobenzyl esterase
MEMEPAHCTGVAYTEELQDRVSDAWIAFMNAGNPSTKQLQRTPFTTENPDRMILAETCGMEKKSDTELLQLLEKCFLMITNNIKRKE